MSRAFVPNSSSLPISETNKLDLYQLVSPLPILEVDDEVRFLHVEKARTALLLDLADHGHWTTSSNTYLACGRLPKNRRDFFELSDNVWATALNYGDPLRQIVLAFLTF